jgi:hypothetical protein
VDAIKILDGLATPPGQAAGDASRFVIQINLGSDIEYFNKSRAVTADDPDDISTTQKMIATDKPAEGDDGEHI